MDVARCSLIFYLGPALHDGVFELHTQLILSKSFFIDIDVTSIVIVEDIVKGKRVIRRKKLLLHMCALLLQVLTLFRDLSHLFLGEKEA